MPTRKNLPSWCLGSLLTVGCSVGDEPPLDELEHDEDDDVPAADEPPVSDGGLVGPADPAENMCPPVAGNTCHPIYQYECPAGQGCYWDGAVFACAVDMSGAGGAEGQACGSQAECDPGLACLNGDYVPGGCPPSWPFCCVPFEPGGAQCSGPALAEPWYPVWAETPAPSDCYARIGICAHLDPHRR